MSHRITIVDDDALPEGHDFVFVTLPGGRAHIFYRRSTLDREPLEDSWAAYRAVTWRRPPRAPVSCYVASESRLLDMAQQAS